MSTAGIAQLAELQTEDLKVPGSIPGLGICVSDCFAGVPKHPESICLNYLLEFLMIMCSFCLGRRHSHGQRHTKKHTDTHTPTQPHTHTNTTPPQALRNHPRAHSARKPKNEPDTTS